jgi:radical SAM protein with 4Fe4S-binding SPASM domain
MNETTTRRLSVLGWEITNSCNLHCPHCYNPVHRQDTTELSTAECQRVLDAAAQLGTELIGWTGGEPLLRPDLEDLIDYAATTHGIQSGITTNGVLLDRERAKRLAKANLRLVQISLDGTTSERSRQIRRTTDDEFRSIIEAVSICREQGFETHLAMLLGLENLDDAYAMVRLARELGVDGLRFCGFTPEGRARSRSIERRFQFGDKLPLLHAFIEEASADDAIQVVFDPGFGPVPPDYCFHECVAGIETCYIKANGDVYPCTAMLYDQFKVGNLRDRPLGGLWEDQAMTLMSRFDHSQVEGICSVCDNSDYCRGACRNLTYAHTGSFQASFPNCLYQITNSTPAQSDSIK